MKAHAAGALCLSDRGAPYRERLCAIVKHNHRFVWRTLRRLGVAEADADDATQQVFMVLYRKLERVAPAKERSFLYGVTVRVARAHTRRRRRRRELPLEDVEPVDHGPRPDARTHQADCLAQLDAMLAQLPCALRTVFVLHEVEEMTVTDIAEGLSIPRGTAASRLRRAREQLRRSAARWPRA